ncbi:MAG: TrmH family RNA methyltransferase [Christensenellales bacterium]
MRGASSCSNVMNPTNIGAIFRSAAALGMDAVLLTTAQRSALSPRLARQHGKCVPHPVDLPARKRRLDALLRDLGFRTVAMALRNDSVRLDDPRLAAEEKLAIVMGTGDGLASSTIASCDYTVRIPMYHGVDSLNVAAAAPWRSELGLPAERKEDDMLNNTGFDLWADGYDKSVGSPTRTTATLCGLPRHDERALSARARRTGVMCWTLASHRRFDLAALRAGLPHLWAGLFRAHDRTGAGKMPDARLYQGDFPKALCPSFAHGSTTPSSRPTRSTT